MRVYGVDFTSVPGRRKSIDVAACRIDGDALRFERLERVRSFPAFEAFLRQPGPWIAGFDFPFTQARLFLRNIGWPAEWAAVADHVGSMSRSAFRQALEGYKAERPMGDREHSRGFEAGTGAASPQKLYGVPVALMFFEGVSRLRRAGLHVPGLVEGDRTRVAVEAYPGMTARAMIGRTPYKSETRAKQTPELLSARRAILRELTGDAGRVRFGLRIAAPAWLADDAGGDPLDALICAVQAAWALRLMQHDPDLLTRLDVAEGWIAEPAIIEMLAPAARRSEQR